MGEHTFLDKRLAYENSMRVPMLIRYPKLIKENRHGRRTVFKYRYRTNNFSVGWNRNS